MTTPNLGNNPQKTTATNFTENKNNEYSPKEHAAYESYNYVDEKNANFDVGSYCLAKEKQGAISFEECLAVAAAKIMKNH